MKRKVYKYNDFLFSTFDGAHDYMVYCLEHIHLVKIRAWESIYSTQEYKDEIKKIEDYEVDEIVRGNNYALAMDLFAITETMKIGIMTNFNINDMNDLIDLLQVVVNRAYDGNFYK